MDNSETANPAARNSNELLAEQIFRQLLEAKLISNDGKAAFISGLGQGTLKEGNWKIALEQVLHTQPMSDETSET